MIVHEFCGNWHEFYIKDSVGIAIRWISVMKILKTEETVRKIGWRTELYWAQAAGYSRNASRNGTSELKQWK